jgi:hypothetical protein
LCSLSIRRACSSRRSISFGHFFQSGDLVQERDSLVGRTHAMTAQAMYSVVNCFGGRNAFCFATWQGYEDTRKSPKLGCRRQAVGAYHARMSCGSMPLLKLPRLPTATECSERSTPVPMRLLPWCRQPSQIGRTARIPTWHIVVQTPCLGPYCPARCGSRAPFKRTL